MKTSAHSPAGPGERALVSHLRRSRNKKQIAIAAAIAPQVILSEPTEPAMPLKTETKEVDETTAEPVLEKTDEQLPASAPEPTA